MRRTLGGVGLRIVVQGIWAFRMLGLQDFFRCFLFSGESVQGLRVSEVVREGLKGTFRLTSRILVLGLKRLMLGTAPTHHPVTVYTGGNIREQVAVGPGFLKHHILYILCIG